MKQPGIQNGHNPRNMTRRQLMGQGLLACTALAFTNSLSMLLGRTAHAAPSTRIPFLSIDMSGGSNIAGSNVMVGKNYAQQDFLASYKQLGLPDDMHPSKSGQLDTRLGLAFHADSALLRGIASVVSASTMASIDGFIIPGFSLDDSRENQQSPAHWIHRWGMRGTLTDLIGTSGSPSGAGVIVPPVSLVPTLSPIIVNGRDSAVNIAAVGDMQSDHYSNRGSNARATRVVKSTARMNELVLGRIHDRDLATFHKENLRRSYGALSTALMVDRNAIDPGIDPVCLDLYPNIASAPPGDEPATAVSICKLLLEGFAGIGGISLPGFDYHTGERATGELADLRAGRVIGYALEMAARKNKDLFIYVSTDGAQNSDRQSIDNSPDGRGKLGWAGDSGTHGASFVLVYRSGNAGRPPILKEGRQYGAWVEGGGVDMSSSPVATLPDRQAALVFANYLALHGAEGDYANMLGTANPLPAPFDKHLYFGKMTT